MSRKACLGILRRARERGKPLPPQLEAALKAQAGLTVYLTPIADAPTVTAFAANQRDEVRDLHDVAGALSAQPNGAPAQTQRSGLRGERRSSGMSELSPTGGGEGYGACDDAKQQTFVADCLNPWDTQQARITAPEGVSPTINSGEAKPGGLIFTAGFCAGAGPSAGSIGYQEEVAPTLKAAASGNMMPSVLCLNDQGGKTMDCSEDVSGTLRAQEHGHQPLVYENHGVDARYTGPHAVVPTLSARAGTGGNNLPLVGAELYERHRCDKFKPSGTVSTQSSRQHKDATDLVYQQEENLADSEIGIPLLIRRLTPRECERLQGFPDDWTNLPGAADAPRYKALGNSVAIPCVEYLMHGMALVLRAG